MLKQILVNLVKNAIEALAPGGGRIEIANRGHVNRERRLYLELVVSDTGPGPVARGAGQPVLAVKSAKEGAHHGLGLSIVHGLVKKLTATSPAAAAAPAPVLKSCCRPTPAGAAPALPARALGSA
jgi:C4-dicarboxylate-specific signal transduction histidine kinase